MHVSACRHVILGPKLRLFNEMTNTGVDLDDSATSNLFLKIIEPPDMFSMHLLL